MQRLDKWPLRKLLEDGEVMREIAANRASLEDTRDALQATRNDLEGTEDAEVLSVVRGDGDLDEDQLSQLVEGREESAITPDEYTRTEAIVQLTGRPVLLIQAGQWETPSLATLRQRLRKAEAALKQVIPCVGRVELADQRSNYIGTGWLLERDVLITNRHVAGKFAARAGAVATIGQGTDGRAFLPQVDFLREYQRDAVAQRRIRDIVYLEENSPLQPDFALLLLDGSGDDLAPIELDDRDAERDADIAVIGYPAEDSRNDTFVMADIFKGIYRVKRLSPGKVRGVAFDGKVLEHDCTTLGGNSGSVLLNLDTGKACGLHYSGDYRVNNYAVTAGWLKLRLAEVGRRPVRSTAPAASPGAGRATADALANAARVADPAGTAGTEAPAPTAADLDGRPGYQPGFLGADEPEVPLPTLPEELQARVAPVQDDEAGELRYTHFSVVMCADRRVAFFTACNIAGGLLFNFPRASDRWYPDPRLQNVGDQTDGSLYTDNPLDRGHLVRRLDPAWGDTREEAKQAELDTFFFTNCSPQHSRLNQRTWLSLEDYVLGNAATHDLKVTVFTGPVLRPTDREYRGVKLPEEFWKVVVIRNAFTGKLSATAYLLSQAADLQDLEFVYGEFETYQLPLDALAARTGLDFGDLRRYDPLARQESLALRVIGGAADLVL